MASADLLAIRNFLGLAVDEAGPYHSTISRTRRLIDVETHKAVFAWVLERLAGEGLLQVSVFSTMGPLLFKSIPPRVPVA